MKRDSLSVQARRLERRQCIARIRRWCGLTNSEKQIAIDAINGKFDGRIMYAAWRRREKANLT